MEARVVIFEDSIEVQRVFKHIFREQSEENVNNITLLTSAMYFEDVTQWVYLGASKIKKNNLERVTFSRLTTIRILGGVPRFLGNEL